MITCIREVRKAKGLTLQDVAERCDPPTTPQTVGRLETGTRTVSVAWLNRIAGALGVDPSQLVTHPDRQDLPVVAILGASGVNAPRKAETAVPPRPSSGALRSEEHTYELQSLMRISYAVFCLKKQNNRTKEQTTELHQ